MENYFPADVSLRVTGDLGEAQKLFPAAKQLLFRANKMKMTGSPVVRLFQPGTDGSLVQVFLIGNHKHVYVQPAPRVTVPVPEDVLVLEALGPHECPNMLSGLVVPGTGVLQMNGAEAKHNPDGTDDYAIHAFHPTGPSASIYSLNFAYQDVDRLGVESDPDVTTIAPMQVRWPKPSMYSGAMKRVVQAIYGIGKTEDEGPGLISDEAYADAPYYAAQNHYRCLWTETDGIRRVGDDFWLIRISQDDGVLAMPLPLFDCTTGDAFLNALADIGDVDTYSVVAEFGGLPTGETFPEDFPTADPPTFARTAAIAAGRMLQLLNPADILPFYNHVALDIDKSALYHYCGWAFSDSGAAHDAHNTCFWYSNKAAATALIGNWATDGFDTLPLEDRMLRAEHWKVAINLSAINRNLAEAPVGTGSAVLSLVEASLMIGEPYYVNAYRFDLGFFKVPTYSGGEDVATFEFWGRTSTALHELSWPIVRDAVYDISCPVTAFYIGEALEVVRHQPPKTYEGTIIRGPWIETFPGTIAFGTGDPFYAEHGFSRAPELIYTFATSSFDWFNLELSSEDGSVVNTEVARKLVPDELPFLFLNGDPVSVLDYYGVEGPEYEWDPVVVSYVVNYRPQMLRAGRFYSTSLDVRENRRHGSVLAGGDVESLIDYADLWEGDVGVVIPPMCREGCMFVRHFGGRTDELGASHTLLPAGVEQSGVFPGLGAGRIDFATLPEQEVNYGGSAGVRWRSIWTSMFNYRFGFGASVNAGPTKCGIITDGVYRAFYAEDTVLSSGLFLGVHVPVENLPASYLASANGIDVSGATALNATFVGAV